MRIRSIYFRGLLALSFVAVSVLVFYSCKPRRDQSSLASDQSEADVLVTETMIASELQLKVEHNAQFNTEGQSASKPQQLEEEIVEKMRAMKFVDTRLHTLGVLIMYYGSVNYRMQNPNLSENGANSPPEGAKAKIQRYFQETLEKSRSTWDPNAQALYSLCADIMECAYWRTHVVTLSRRTFESYDTILSLLKLMKSDLEKMTPTTITDTQIFATETWILQHRAAGLLNLEANHPAIENAALMTPTFNNSEEFSRLKADTRMLIEKGRRNFFWGNNPNLVNQGFFDDLSIELAQMNVSPKYAGYFEQEQAEIWEMIVATQDAMRETLADLEAMELYYDRIDKESYVQVEAWMKDILSRNFSWIRAIQENGEAEIDSKLVSFATLGSLIRNFHQREFKLPTIDLYQKAAEVLMSRRPPSGGKFNEFSNIVNGIKSSLDYRLSPSPPNLNEGQGPSLLYMVKSFGFSHQYATRMVQNEKIYTQLRGFHSLAYQVLKIGIANARVQILEKRIQSAKTKEEVQSTQELAQDASREAAFQAASLYCLDYLKDNRSSGSLDPALVKADTSVNPMWCNVLGGSFTGDISSCNVRQGKILLSDFCYTPQGNNFFAVQQKANACLTKTNTIQLCAQKGLEMGTTIITGLILPGVGATAGALTKGTFALARASMGGAVGRTLAANPTIAGRLGQFLLKTSVEGAYFGIVNSIAISPLVGWQQAFYNPEMTLSENMRGMMWSYLWSFAFFGFSHNLDKVAYRANWLATTANIKTASFFKNQSWINASKEYLQNIHPDRAPQIAKIGAEIWEKSKWNSSLRTAAEKLDLKAYRWNYYLGGGIRFGAEWFGFRLVEQIEHKVTETVSSHDHLSQMSYKPGWNDWAKQQPEAFLRTLTTVMSFRVKSWHTVYERKLVKPLAVSFEKYVSKNQDPLRTFGLTNREIEGAMKDSKKMDAMQRSVASYAQMLRGGYQHDLMTLKTGVDGKMNDKTSNVSTKAVEDMLTALKDAEDIVNNPSKLQEHLRKRNQPDRARFKPNGEPKSIYFSPELGNEAA